MDYPINVPFNPQPSTIMHIDLNSCFATVEQQADPSLRDKPIAVAAYKSSGGCILAPSIEAKRLGIKVGMRVRDGKALCPNLIVLEPDPWKYRNVHKALNKLLLSYTDLVFPKSIDEFVLDLTGAPRYKVGMVNIATEVKSRIKQEIGDYLTVSIGIAPNRYLAKIASGLRKPDGLDTIDNTNFKNIFSKLVLHDLTGIKTQNIARLNRHEIFSVLDFYEATPMTLQQTFHAVTGHYWYLRLRGWEIDDVATHRGSYSNSVALGKNLTTPDELAPVLINLVEKMAARMRAEDYGAHGVHLSLVYKNHRGFWHKGLSTADVLFATQQIYKVAYKLLLQSPYRNPVHIIAVTCFSLVKEKTQQPYIFDYINKEITLTKVLDSINDKWGNFVITSGKMLSTQQPVKDRIAFGGLEKLCDSS